MKTALTIDSSRPARAGRHQVDGQHRHDDLEQVVVERAQELRPEKGLQSRVLQSLAIAVSRHVVRSPFDGRNRSSGHTIERRLGSCPERVLRNAEKR